jgi:hypothetical protein
VVRPEVVIGGSTRRRRWPAGGSSTAVVEARMDSRSVWMEMVGGGRGQRIGQADGVCTNLRPWKLWRGEKTSRSHIGL